MNRTYFGLTSSRGPDCATTGLEPSLPRCKADELTDMDLGSDNFGYSHFRVEIEIQ